MLHTHNAKFSLVAGCTGVLWENQPQPLNAEQARESEKLTVQDGYNHKGYVAAFPKLQNEEMHIIPRSHEVMMQGLRAGTNGELAS